MKKEVVIIDGKEFVIIEEEDILIVDYDDVSVQIEETLQIVEPIL